MTTPTSSSSFSLSVQPVDRDGQQVSATLSGRLDMDTAGSAWRGLRDKLRSADLRFLRLDVSGMQYVDSAGLALLDELRRDLRNRGGGLELIGLSREDASKLQNFAELVPAPPALAARPAFLERFGVFVLSVFQGARELVGFAGSFTAGFAQALRRPGSVRWRDVALICEAVGANAAPIIILIGFLMGLIISFQSAMPLRMFGAEIYVARLLGLSMLRELGPLVTAIILAGRSGASFAAELGTMKINQELDALNTMGLDPMRFLVVPRMIAAMLMTPLLTLVFNLFSLVGGGVVMLSLGYPLVTYISQVTMSVDVGDLLNGLFKSFVFSILVGWIGCVRGLQTGQGAWAVGAAATSAVVSGIILIAVMDGIFAVFFYVFNY